MRKVFTITRFGSPEFDNHLARAVVPYSGNFAPLLTILKQLNDPPLACKTVVFEEKYVDEDYQDEFAAFYSKTFKRYPHRCTRIHFFADVVPTRTRTGFSRYRDSYLGFVILRPLDLQRVGRTILRPPVRSDDSEFITCKAKFPSHIYGDKFEPEAMPFIQQDTQVGACAQASLWMLARYMSQRFNCREFLPSEINALAKANVTMGRPLPAEDGLTAIQIMDALQGMGFPSVMYRSETVDGCSRHIEAAFPIQGRTKKKRDASRDLRRTAKLADIAYRYIESGLPVILGTADHAVVAVGHTYEHAAINSSVAIQRIPSFFINNDNTGPYQKMPLFVRNPNQLSFLDVQTVITVAPPEVTLKGEEAERMATTSVELFLAEPLPNVGKSFNDILPTQRKEFGPWLNKKEYRTYLMRSVQLQQDIRTAMKEKNLLRAVGEKLLVLDYPKYVWVTEISSPDLLNRATKGDRECLGFVIVDSTAPSRTQGVIAMHYADLFRAQMRDDPGKELVVVIPNSTPFKHRLSPG